MQDVAIPPLPPKAVHVVFDPKSQSFSYSGDIDPKSETITVYGQGLARISLILEGEGATWAAKPLRWIDHHHADLEAAPECMKLERVGDKMLLLEDHCDSHSEGEHRFCLHITHGGKEIASDPRVINDPSGP